MDITPHKMNGKPPFFIRISWKNEGNPQKICVFSCFIQEKYILLQIQPSDTVYSMSHNLNTDEVICCLDGKTLGNECIGVGRMKPHISVRLIHTYAY